eukprot:2982557-Amphidinium_carterae.1
MSLVSEQAHCQKGSVITIKSRGVGTAGYSVCYRRVSGIIGHFLHVMRQASPLHPPQLSSE